MKNWGQVPSFFPQCNAQNTAVAVDFSLFSFDKHKSHSVLVA